MTTACLCRRWQDGSAPRWLRRSLRGGESGQAIVWVAVMLPFLLSVVGLSVDGGTVFATRTELQSAANGAARVAAMQVDLQAYRASDGARVVLDTARARQAAADYLARQLPQSLQGTGAAATTTISAEPQRVVVRLERDVPLAFLPLVGMKTAHVVVTAPAALRYGVERAEG